MAERTPDSERQRTQLRERPGAVPVPTQAFSIVVLDGPAKGRHAEIDATSPERLLIGKSEACALQLPDPTVSRRHLALEVTECGLRLVDLGSRNGTFVNGLRVVDAFADVGATVRIGDTTLTIEPAARAKPARVSHAMRFGRLVGGSLAMRRLYPLCERVAAADVPCVIEGETGTGKEVLAESLHEAGPRANAPFVVFDCTAVPPSLFESALFGHERGAFTGALATRKGALEQAHGGTLFIDEIGDLALPLQAKLLRAIERSEIQRVGAAGWTRVDVRILAATRRDLEREVADGRFRDDLFFRLAVTRVELPALRRRAGDVTLLAEHFWRTLGGCDRPFPAGVLTRFEAYEWPGNVRELRNAVARQLALGELANAPGILEEEADESTPSDSAAAAPPLDDAFAKVLARGLPLTRARQEVVEAFERVYVERILQKHGGNVRQAANASGIARRYFQLLRAKQAKGDQG